MLGWLFSIYAHVFNVLWHQDMTSITVTPRTQSPCVVHHDGEAGACGGVLIPELWR